VTRPGRFAWALALLAVIAVSPLAATAARPRPASAAAVSTSRFESVGPLRLADTRQALCGCERVDATTVRIDIAHAASSSAAASDTIVAAAVTVTATNTSTDGFVTAYPSGTPRPATSTLNARTGVDTSNSAIVPVGSDGRIDVFAQSPTDLVVDLTGVFVGALSARAGRFESLAPVRVIDTRLTSADGLSPFTTIIVPLPAGVAPDASALAVNVTTVGERSAGFVRGFAAGTAEPLTSFVNPDGTGRPKAAAVILPASAQGISLMTSAGGNVVVDVVGWFTGASAPDSNDGLFVPMTPTRLLDTRDDKPRLWANATREIASPVTGGAALVTNITMALPDNAGFVTAAAAGTARPATSSVNAVARNAVVANAAITAISTRGLSYFSSAGTDLVVDATGSFTGVPVAATLPVPPPVLASPRVLMIGDSTFASLNVVPASKVALRGFDAVLDLEPCRRLVQPSCQSAFTLRTPSTALESIRDAAGSIDIVVIKAGYNEGFATFDSAVRTIMAAARAKGVRTVLWLTYSEGAAGEYTRHNAILRSLAASGAYPDLAIADWNAYAAASTGWYADDHIHLIRNGAWATADYVTRWVAHLVDNPCPTPWAPGSFVDAHCPSPDEYAKATGTLPDLHALYGV